MRASVLDACPPVCCIQCVWLGSSGCDQLLPANRNVLVLGVPVTSGEVGSRAGGRFVNWDDERLVMRGDGNRYGGLSTSGRKPPAHPASCTVVGTHVKDRCKDVRIFLSLRGMV